MSAAKACEVFFCDEHDRRTVRMRDGSFALRTVRYPERDDDDDEAMDVDDHMPDADER